MSKVHEIEIYWEDLTEDKCQQLLALGFNDDNVISGIVPLTTILLMED